MRRRAGDWQGLINWIFFSIEIEIPLSGMSSVLSLSAQLPPKTGSFFLRRHLGKWIKIPACLCWLFYTVKDMFPKCCSTTYCKSIHQYCIWNFRRFNWSECKVCRMHKMGKWNFWTKCSFSPGDIKYLCSVPLVCLAPKHSLFSIPVSGIWSISQLSSCCSQERCQSGYSS